MLTVKNTFFDVESDVVSLVESKRSSSLPRSWKPSSQDDLASSRTTSPRWANIQVKSEASTTDSDDEPCTECGYDSSDPLCSQYLPHSDDDATTEDGLESSGEHYGAISSSHSSTDSDDTASDPNVRRGIGLSLCDAIPQTKLVAPGKTKLSSKARMFELPLPTDMRNVLLAATASMRHIPKLLNVQMSDGKLGGETTIVFSHARGLQTFDFVKILATVKMVLLDAASSSEETYVMGYDGKPFSATGTGKNTTWGFSCKLSSVPAHAADTTCWDTYRTGFCPRASTCRWCHPLDSDLLTVVVMLRPVDQCFAPQQNLFSLA